MGSAGRPQKDACDVECGQIDGRGLLVAGGDASPLLQAVDAALDRIALPLNLPVEGRCLPPRLPRRRRWCFWSFGTGITVLMPRLRRCSRISRGEYALSARSTTGLVRGRPMGRGTRKRVMTSVKEGASPACPAVRTKARGRQLPSAARWIFVVSPPRDRPMAWSTGSPADAPFFGPQPRADARARWWSQPKPPSYGRCPRRRGPSGRRTPAPQVPSRAHVRSLV